MSKSEHARARLWRVNRDLTMQELSDLTGYSVAAICLFEAGVTSVGAGIAPEVWRRYKLCCAAVEAGAVRKFDW